MKRFALFLVGLLLFGVCYAGTVNRSESVVNLSTTTATKALDVREKRKAICIKNLDTTTTVYCANATISIAGWSTSTGKSGVIAIPAGSSYNEEGDYTYSREMYMVAEPSATANVNVNVSERW